MREKERERNLDVRDKHRSVASHTYPNRGPGDGTCNPGKPATQACALTGN